VTSSRLVSLDAFRGFTIASMVLVNNPGDWDHVYPQLDHAAWNGWTFTDLIFPFFLFISGVALSLSIARRRAGALADERRQLLFSLWQRAAIIFLIGLALNFVPNFDLATLRIPGVLQRIALCTALAAPLVLYCNWRALFGWLVGLLAFYAAAMLLVPVPDPSGVVVAGALEPGRDLGAFIDRLLLSGHLWAKSRTWDPEGLFSTLPALATMLGGVLTGHWLSRDLGEARKTLWMMIAGSVCILLGVLLDAALMPINKSLWSPSYAVFTAGWALLLFGCFYWLIDGVDSSIVRTNSQRLSLPWIIYGMNALFIFVCSGLIARLLGYFHLAVDDGKTVSLKEWIYTPFQTLPIAAQNRSLLFAVAFNLCMFALAWYLWRKKWFITV
jgi:predicted acyltransferase